MTSDAESDPRERGRIKGLYENLSFQQESGIELNELKNRGSLKERERITGHGGRNAFTTYKPLFQTLSPPVLVTANNWEHIRR